jgi:hypothetical protein
MTEEIIGFTAIIGLFIVLPSLLVGANVAGRWFKLKMAELQIRRDELELEKKKFEYLAAETNRETVEKLERL